MTGTRVRGDGMTGRTGWFRAGLIAVAAAVSALGGGSDATAQTRGDFINAFAGEWRTLSGNFTPGGERCTVRLLASDSSPLPLANEGCARELASLSSWEIDGGQIVLYDGGGTELGRLGGNQRRLGGPTIAGNALILERRDGGFASAEPGCVYLGYTSSCAGLDDLATPRIDNGAQITVLTRANLRASAGLSADILEIVPPNTCLAVDRCTANPEGAWCRARFEGRVGWVKKEGTRLDRYPTVVFSNGC